jgi:hypothetical protein
MSNLLYLVKNRAEDFILYLEKNIVDIDKTKGIVSSGTYLDYRALTKADVDWMLGQIASWGQYTTIVCDIGGGALSDMTILECFDKVIMPVLDDDISINKLKSFDELLEAGEMGKISSRILRTQIPNEEYDSAVFSRWLGRKLEEGWLDD